MHILEYNSQIPIAEFALRNCLMVQVARFSSDNRLLGVKVLCNEGQELLLLIDLAKMETLGMVSNPGCSSDRIREFVFSQAGMLVSCGRQHLGDYRLRGELLQF